MRKQEILKIPYMTPPEPDEEATYIAKTAVHIIGHKKTLFVEVFKNNQPGNPIVRYVNNKDDWGIYIPSYREWSGYGFENGPIYLVNGVKVKWIGNNAEYGIKIASAADEKRVQKYFGDEEERWLRLISKQESTIRGARDLKVSQRRRTRLKERCDAVGEKTDKEMSLMSEHYGFWKHILYYKKFGDRAEIACSACGQVVKGVWRTSREIETFWRVLENPQPGRNGICQLCGRTGMYRQAGRCKKEHSEDVACWSADPYKERGAVVRYFSLGASYEVKTLKDHLIGAKETYYGAEVARGFFETGKKLQIDYHKRDPYLGQEFWDDCNLAGLANITTRRGYLIPDTMHRLKGTILEYCAADILAHEVKIINLLQYAEAYMKFPQMEMLVKMGYFGAVDNISDYKCGIIADGSAKSPEAFFGVNKEDLEYVKRRGGCYEYVTVARLKKNMGCKWTYDEMDFIANILCAKNWTWLLDYMSIKQLIHRIEKYAGEKYGDGAMLKLRHAASTYIDYLTMRQQEGYDLNDSIILYPRDLEVAHDHMVEEVNREKNRHRDEEVDMKYTNINRKYRKWLNLFGFEAAGLTIRPARRASEITKEGRLLHHCVGSDNYLNKHNKGESIICFLRFKDKPDEPYITVEIDAESFRIIQWYGAYDKKPDQDIIQPWLDEWVDVLILKGEEKQAV